ncbi:DNA cytosine methyltransferase [Megalodesulfovibrio gigas]|uniref:Cytosine-specific methyltransferase n=1 Tax=Megalodesulfovibrio gigas (strain ATCC 19364 / DSM 1382 / NCIMB 9332 / VKM B-1759) TaxID=1121448 RepID=T2GA77_MEGG1|nr:DNA cytosine methyltransferase [Megalodesulfovibrio gigas]AGW12822.1 putative cytosine methyltransferase [Megalodesulfovibrio gigas DSM 1382 = ATCC 19364]
MGSFYEFFAGGGMARAGLGHGWRCLFANDFDLKKARTYEANWGLGAMRACDVRSLSPSDLPGRADLVWGSFPCQDLSLAGGGAGLRGERSGTFWPFWSLMRGIIADGRAPKLIVLENVCGALSSHGGKDFAAICSAYIEAGYNVGAMVLDAALFLPQSRKRLFIIGVRGDIALPAFLTTCQPSTLWHSPGLIRAHGALPGKTHARWLWWALPQPPKRKSTFADLVEEHPEGVSWHSPAETEKLLRMMSALNVAKVETVKQIGRKLVGGVYKRTRRDEYGRKVQRAEVRFDEVAGCLRTPAGGSSRQTILVVEGERVRSRLLSTRETARLMGLPESYRLPQNYNEAYHLTGDGVAVPVVSYLATHLFNPILRRHALAADKAAA